MNPKDSIRKRKPVSYWLAYGGWPAFIKSPILWASIIISGLCLPLWEEKEWWNSVTSILPNILGFSIGAFAIFLGLGNERFKDAMHKFRRAGVPLYLKVSAIFVHQILIQTFSVVYAILAGSFYKIDSPVWFSDINNWIRPAFWGIGFFLFIYSILLVVSTALNIFSVARMLNIAEMSSAAAKDQIV